MSDVTRTEAGFLSAGMKPLPRTWGELVSPTTRIQIAVLGVLTLAAFWQPLNDLVISRWTSDPNWSHGWLVPLFSLYFVSTQRKALAKAGRRINLWGGLLLGLSLALYFGSMIILRKGYPQMLAMVATIAAMALFLGGWEVLRLVWFPIAFLIVAIPLPDSVYFQLTWPLRVVASELGALLLSFIPDLVTDRSGVVIEYMYQGRQGQLNVEEACSGMRLMMAFVTLGLAMAYLGDRPLWQRAIMVLSCIPIAVFCNVLRVALTGVIHVFEWKSLASGTPHELLGLAMLPIALGLFSLIGYVLKNLFVEAA